VFLFDNGSNIRNGNGNIERWKMTREEIINGLQFTVDMFLLDPTTGETYTEPRNDMDKTTIDACRGAIELLKQEPCEDAVSRQAVLDYAKDTILNLCMHDDTEVFCDEIKDLPSVTPTRKKGKWIKEETIHGWDGFSYQCSKCGRSIHLDTEVEDLTDYPFCHCGAEMESGENEEK
jgi:hypothetical protein